MAWEDVARVPLRVLLNDIDVSYSYSDATLDKLLITSAAFVVMEVNLPTDYVIDFEDETVTPDPSLDSIFINFTVLKAACMKGGWDFNSRMAIDGVMAKLGPVAVDIDSAGSQSLTALLTEGPCKMYQSLLRSYHAGQSSRVKAILSPFSHDDLNICR